MKQVGGGRAHPLTGEPLLPTVGPSDVYPFPYRATKGSSAGATARTAHHAI